MGKKFKLSSTFASSLGLSFYYMLTSCCYRTKATTKLERVAAKYMIQPTRYQTTLGLNYIRNSYAEGLIKIIQLHCYIDYIDSCSRRSMLWPID